MPLDAAHHAEMADDDRTSPGSDPVRPRSGWAAKGSRTERDATRTQRKQLMAERQTADALGDLRRLREIGMMRAEQTVQDGEDRVHGAVRDSGAKPLDSVTAFVQVARAVRQIIVLEQELLGQRPVPVARAAAARPADTQPAVSNRRAPNQSADSDLRERSDLDDLNDYDDRSFQQVLSGIHEALDLPVPMTAMEALAARAAPAVAAKTLAFAAAAPKSWARSHLTASTALATPRHERGPP